ncbi:MAG: glycosyltransferase family 2 protein [Bacteroidales bacterium]
MNDPLITVLLPCYNARAYLPEALESVMHQSYQNLEILCINDGSTDDTGEILEGYAKKDNRIRVVHNETNLKLIKTLNKGIELARGEYIARMDADDVSMPERIEKEMEFLISNNYDFVSCQASFIDKNSGIRKGNCLMFPDHPYSLFYTYFINPFVHSGILIKSEILKTNKYPDVPEVTHTEDYALWAHLLRKGHTAAVLAEQMILYRINDDSVSSDNAQRQLNNFSLQLQNHIRLSLHLEIPIDYVRLLSFDPALNWKKVSYKKLSNYLDKICSVFLKKYPDTNPEIPALIVKQHKRRIHLFALRQTKVNGFAMIAGLHFLFSLRRHYAARRRF